MDAIRIENLRSLTDTGFVDLKPITLLVGQNSSGKSSFLRFFPLLRQSVSAKTAGPISWYGALVDFGSFQESLGRRNAEQEIVLHFRLNIEKEWFGTFNRYTPDKLNILLTLKLSGLKDREATFTKAVIMSIADHQIKIEFDDSGKVIKFQVNTFEVTDIAKDIFDERAGSFLPRITVRRRAFTGRQPTEIREDLLDSLHSDLKKELSLICGTLTEPSDDLDTLFIIFTGIYFASSDAMLKRIKIMFSIEEIKKSFSSDIQLDPVEWTVHDKKFKSLRDRVLAIKLIGLIEKLDSYIYIADLNIRYIAPIRATAERYYRVQNLALGEVDPQGQNVPMILKNMEESERKNFEIWTKDHFGFILRAVSSGGHISLNMKDISDSEEFNLADTGFGYSQILPILLQLWLLLTKKSGPLPVIFAIEQPELHLHPGLQAKLADVFIASIKLARENEIDLRLIIETHSEIIVNRMGHRIANEDLSPEDVNVVLFEKEPSALSTKVSFSGYDEDGFLTNWPIGFLEPDII